MTFLEGHGPHKHVNDVD
uniref:Uncharacterized protein n=1 Tax=Arundo donax TaxID=35708 RepID=A0A0A8Y1E6_ARUDO